MKNSIAIIERLKMYSTPELCDGAGDYRTMDHRITRQVTDKKIAGTAFTVKTPYGVSGIVPDAIIEANPGDVIVIAGQGCCEKSYWGDHRSICATMKGIAGIVIDGAFRDKAGCEEAGVPVFAMNVVPGSAGKQAEGELNVPVVCGGVEVLPGDYIVGDENGIIVIRPEEAEVIMVRAQAKIDAENEIRAFMEKTGKVIPRIRKK